ncbi:hypothetical protein Q9Q99_04085 [Curtobacterium flaccumfaciens]|nr:hypothetical protein Q9Q99_04085 [Curtobacterium flaccumfaciens]
MVRPVGTGPAARGGRRGPGRQFAGQECCDLGVQLVGAGGDRCVGGRRRAFVARGRRSIVGRLGGLRLVGGLRGG